MTPTNPFPTREGGVSARPRTPQDPEAAPLTPAELAGWLDLHREAIAERWLTELRSRTESLEPGVHALLESFLELLTALLAPGVGAYREQVELLFQEAATLFGNLGAHRGQAAGEPVEEFQILREVILRNLYLDPPGAGIEEVGLRELLQLNRLVDVGVAFASVGHTDTLFFHHFQGTGVMGTPTPELLAEVEEQVAGIREELDRLLEHTARERAEGTL